MQKFNTLAELYKTLENDILHTGFDLSPNVIIYDVMISDDSNVDIMVIGEAPGETEEKRGFPFVGRSGQLLRTMIIDSGLTNIANIYITNFCKQRPPDNRNPYISELSFYLPYILQEIELVSPSLIITTGQIPYTALTGDITKISQTRGNITSIGDNPSYPILPIFHPAYLLRQGNKSGGPRMLTKLDLIKARKFINERS